MPSLSLCESPLPPILSHQVSKITCWLHQLYYLDMWFRCDQREYSTPLIKAFGSEIGTQLRLGQWKRMELRWHCQERPHFLLGLLNWMSISLELPLVNSAPTPKQTKWKSTEVKVQEKGCQRHLVIPKISSPGSQF